MERTTNIEEIDQGRAKEPTEKISWAEVQRLNAGTWFLASDPFGTVHSLTEEEKRLISTQRVPAAETFLRFAKEANKFFIYDIKCPSCRPGQGDGSCDDGDCVDDMIRLLRQTGSAHHVWWYQGREKKVRREFPGILVAAAVDGNPSTASTTDIINANWRDVRPEVVQSWSERGQWVNVWVVSRPWLFSYFWCAGVKSVTSNDCADLHDLDRPLYFLSIGAYFLIATIVTCCLVLLMSSVVIWMDRTHRKARERAEAEDVALNGVVLPEASRQLGAAFSIFRLP